MLVLKFNKISIIRISKTSCR